MAERDTYSPLQIALHWLVAVLVLAAWFTSDGMGRALDHRLEQGPDGTWPLHVWLGLAVLAVVVLRLFVRRRLGAPPPAQHSDLLTRAARWGHGLLYALVVLIPLVGILVWFVGIEALGDIHGLAGNALLWLAGAHAAMALFHQYVLKDGTLVRMLKPGA